MPIVLGIFTLNEMRLIYCRLHSLNVSFIPYSYPNLMVVVPDSIANIPVGDAKCRNSVYADAAQSSFNLRACTSFVCFLGVCHCDSIKQIKIHDEANNDEFFSKI